MFDFINTQIVKAQAALHVAKESLMERAEGQAMVEYGLILVLVSVVAIVGLTVVGGQLYVANETGTTYSATTGVITWAKTPGVFNQLIAALSNNTKFS